MQKLEILYSQELTKQIQQQPGVAEKVRQWERVYNRQLEACITPEHRLHIREHIPERVTNNHK